MDETEEKTEDGTENQTGDTTDEHASPSSRSKSLLGTLVLTLLFYFLKLYVLKDAPGESRKAALASGRTNPKPASAMYFSGNTAGIQYVRPAVVNLAPADPSKRMAHFEREIAKFRNSTDTNEFEQYIWALARKADLLNDKAAQLEIHEEIIDKLRGVDTVFAHFNLARSLSHKAALVEDAQEKVRLLNEAIQAKESPNPRVQMIVAGAMIHKAGLADAVVPQKEKTALLNEIIERFSGSPDPDVREYVATAMAQKSDLVAPPRSLLYIDAMLFELLGTRSPFARQLVARALLEKATHTESGELRSKLYAAIRDQFGTSTDPYLSSVAKRAAWQEAHPGGASERPARSAKLNGTAVELMARADKANDDDEREYIYAIVVDRFGGTPGDSDTQVAVAGALAGMAALATDNADRILCYNLTIALYLHSDIPAVKYEVIHALLNKADIVRTKRAKLDQYDLILDTFANDKNMPADLMEAVRQARAVVEGSS